MKLLIKPVDVWMFRNGRPFNAGSDHQASSLFPPHPSVIQGVLRSYHLVVEGVDLSDRVAIEAAVGTATTYRWHPIRGPFVAKMGQDKVWWRYYPLPADALHEEGDRVRAAELRNPTDLGVITDCPTPLLLWPKGKPKKGDRKLWLREDELQRYLHGNMAQYLPEKKLFGWESRFGIGRDDFVRTARDSLLFEAQYVRLVDEVGLEVDIDGLEGWPDRGILRMGGEGRAGIYSLSNSTDWPAPPDPLPDRFRLYLATPAYFHGGWKPRDWGAFFDGNVELMAAAVGRYEAVGGYDMALRRQKPSRRYIPAGGVYYFQSHGLVRWRKELPIVAFTEDGAEMGYGQFLIGRW